MVCMPVVGLTSSIACGKSSVARAFAEMGAELIDADEIVHELYRKPAMVTKIRVAFGKGAIKNKGGKKIVNREVLAELVFSDARKLKKLNSIVHPAVVREIGRKIRRARKKIIVVDAPLLFEAKLAKMFDVVVAVKAGRKNQIARLRKRGLSTREACARIASQMPLREKVKLADYAIDTNGTRRETMRQVRGIYREITGLA
ncbi:dephospho-CoA kinase [Candidatus Micrarchaeota archaeon]|nr:dephospho-CoA kinase [Candidatus Micrarchaeota archaeon]MBU1940030.1 dephospho-CoA kinase [Candidatus Micrarchaeota archaeon]